MTQSKPCIKVAWLTEMTEPQETKQWEAPWDRVLAEVCTVQPHGGQSDSVYQKCKCTNLPGQQCYVLRIFPIYKELHFSIICNSKKMETTTSIEQWLNSCGKSTKWYIKLFSMYSHGMIPKMHG